MWGPIAAAGITAAGSLASGLLSGNKQQGESGDYLRQLWLQQQQGNLEYERQKEFAQQGIRWRVADAKAAGLHPVFALGGSGATYSPSGISVGSLGSGFDSTGSSLSSGIAGAASALGQGIDRAMYAKATQEERTRMEQEREASFQAGQEMRDLQVENARLQNQQLQGDIAMQQARLSDMVVRNQQQVPPMPNIAVRSDGAVIPGQTQSTSSSLFKVNPAEVTANVPGRPGTEAGTIPDLSFARTNDGGYVPIPSKDIKERIEDDWINETTWKLRNMLPALHNSPSVSPPSGYLPNGDSQRFTWRYSVLKGAWYAVPRTYGRHRFVGYDSEPTRQLID